MLGVVALGVSLFNSSAAILTIFNLAIGAEFLEALALATFTLFLDQTLALTLLLGADHVAHGSSSTEEVGVVGVDVGALDRDERLNIRRGRAKTLAEQVGYGLNELGLQSGVARQLSRSASVANLDELFVDKLNAAVAGDLKELNLRLDKQVKGHLGNKQARARSSRVADSCADVEGRQVRCGVDRLERAAKDRVEDVVDASTTAELLGRDFGRGTVNGRNKGRGESSHLLQNKRSAVLLAAKGSVTVAGKLLLGLTHESVEASLDVGQSLTDVTHEGCVERLGKELGTAAVGNVAVGRVVLEEVVFGLQRLVHGLVALDVLLGTVDDTNEAQLQGVDSAREDIKGVGAVVHEIELGQDTNGAAAEGIDMAGKLERLRVDNVDIGGGDGENDTVGLGNVLGNQVSGLLLDIGRLVANWDLGQTGKIN